MRHCVLETKFLAVATAVDRVAHFSRLGTNQNTKKNTIMLRTISLCDSRHFTPILLDTHRAEATPDVLQSLTVLDCSHPLAQSVLLFRNTVVVTNTGLCWSTGGLTHSGLRLE